jgi:hypothetical protein
VPRYANMVEGYCLATSFTWNEGNFLDLSVLAA